MKVTLLFAADSSSNTSAKHLLAALTSDPAHAIGVVHTGISFTVALLKKFSQDIDLVYHW